MKPKLKKFSSPLNETDFFVHFREKANKFLFCAKRLKQWNFLDRLRIFCLLTFCWLVKHSLYYSFFNKLVLYISILVSFIDIYSLIPILLFSSLFKSSLFRYIKRMEKNPSTFFPFENRKPSLASCLNDRETSSL